MSIPSATEMPDTAPAPLAWSTEEYRQFGLTTQVSRHNYQTLPVFEKSALIALLDEYPARRLQAYTMGQDPTQNQDWQQVTIAPETSGEDMWRAVQNGRLWLNLTHIEIHCAPIKTLIDAIYAHLGEHCPHLKHPQSTHSALLISSPGAQVYYHLDAEPNMLWHISGEKDIWVYPAMDSELVPQRYLEDIYAGEIGENLPYNPEFDKRASRYRLTPGDAVSWPHNGPHRIVNLDMNISLATSYSTPLIYRRKYTQLANKYLLRNMGITHRSSREAGLAAAGKRITYRVLNKLKPFKRADRTATYITDLQLDPDSVNGLKRLSEPMLASFANQASQSASVKLSAGSAEALG